MSSRSDPQLILKSIRAAVTATSFTTEIQTQEKLWNFLLINKLKVDQQILCKYVG